MRMKILLANQTDSHAISKSAIPTLHLAVCYGCKGVLYFFLFGVFRYFVKERRRKKRKSYAR